MVEMVQKFNGISYSTINSDIKILNKKINNLLTQESIEAQQGAECFIGTAFNVWSVAGVLIALAICILALSFEIQNIEILIYVLLFMVQFIILISTFWVFILLWRTKNKLSITERCRKMVDTHMSDLNKNYYNLIGFN